MSVVDYSSVVLRALGILKGKYGKTWVESECHIQCIIHTYIQNLRYVPPNFSRGNSQLN